MSALDDLLDRAERGDWPARSNDDAWALLINWAFQTACLQADEEENVQWEEQMRALLRRELDADAFVAARMDALSYRTRARKLTQANLRYAYGFRGHRGRGLVHREVRRFFRRWSD